MAFAALLLSSVTSSAQSVAPDSTVTPVMSPDTVATDSVVVPRPLPPEAYESPSLMDRAKKGTANFLSDTWHVVSFPARLNGPSALGTAAFVGATVVLFQYDQDIFDATQRNQNEQPFKNLMDFADKYVEIGFMPNAIKVEAGVAVIGYVVKYEPLKQIPVELIESHLIAGGLRNILKPIVGRAHPYEDLGPHHFEFNNGTSFPSGHTSVLFEIATIVSEHAHAWPVTGALFGLATLGAVQRVESKNHWPTDVFVPMVTGTAIAHTIVRRNAERRERDATLQSGWTPMLDVAPGGVRVGMRRGL